MKTCPIIVTLCCLLHLLCFEAKASCPNITSDFTSSVSEVCGPKPTVVIFTNTSVGSRKYVAGYSWYLNGTLFAYTSSYWARPGDTISALGTYNYKLVAHDSLGFCIDSSFLTINIFPKPKSIFSASFDTVCPNQNITFTNSSNDTISSPSYLWEFGDGITATNFNTFHNYGSGASGNYTVKLIASNSPTCFHDTTKVIFVKQSPTITISGDNGDGSLKNCLSAADTNTRDTITFYNSSAPSVNYTWDFGDGSSAFIQNYTSAIDSFTHVYKKYGDFLVICTAIDTNGCTYTDSLKVTFDKDISASFSVPASQNNGCLPHFVRPVNSSDYARKFVWDFDDGTPLITTYDTAAPSHTYTRKGSFIIKLTATNSCNTQIVTVGPIEVADVPEMIYTRDPSNRGCSPQTIKFTNTSSGMVPATNYSWNMGNGNIYSGSNPPDQVYLKGSHLIKLIGHNHCGTDSILNTVYIDSLPSANVIVTPDSGCSPLFVFGNATISGYGSLSRWYLNSSKIASGLTVLKELKNKSNSIRTFDIRHNVINHCGSFDSIVTIKVHPEVEARISPSSRTLCAGGSVTFNSYSYGDSLKYLWDFGNGTTSSTKGPHKVTFNTPGKDTVTLYLDGRCGKDTIKSIITIENRPIAKINYDTLEGCQGMIVNFKSKIASNANYYSWEFNSGSPYWGYDTSEVVTFNSSGTHMVTLRVDTTNCYSIDTVYVKVNPVPVADFTLSPNSICSPGFVSFNNLTSHISGNFYSWDFLNGWLDTGYSPPPVLYTSPITLKDSTFNPKLIVTTNKNCSDSIQKSIIIHPSGISSFSVSDSTLCLGDSVLFYTPLAVSFTYKWDFGDGGSSFLPNPSYLYTSTGNFTVQLITSTPNGCNDTAYRNIIVSNYPIVNAIGDSVCFGDSAFFADSSKGGVVSWLWVFGDGDSSIVQHPSHKYLKDSVYKLILKVKNLAGCERVDTSTVIIYPKVNAGFGLSPACPNSYTAFYDSSLSSITNWKWDFGDGNQSSIKNPLNYFVVGGTYAVKLIVGNVLGCSDTAEKTITIDPIPLTNFKADSVCYGNPTSFFNLTSSSSPVKSYFWDFGDGKSSSQASPVYQYLSAGIYFVSLTVSDSSGCDSTFSDSIVVYPATQANFNATNVCLGSFTTFSNTSIGNTSLSIWDYGDGSLLDTNNLPSINHIYNSSGSFIVALITINSFGCSDTISKTVIVHQNPIAGFSALEDTVCLNNYVNFINNSTGANSYNWNFGNGNTSTLVNPSHLYSGIGKFKVILIANSNFGCLDSITDSVLILNVPAASFSADTVCLTASTSFTNNSASASSFSWSFGDGNSSSATSPNHTYAIDGSFNASLIATAGNGCTDTAYQSIVVYPILTAKFGAALACASSSTAFTDSSLGTATSWYWSFGDGNSSAAQHPNHSYASAGNFNVKLIVSNAGCIDSISKSITVHPVPVAKFSFDTACLGGVTSFTNSSSGTGLSFSWNFGDGNSSAAINPYYVYAVDSNYSVSLIAATPSGCADTLFKNVIVYPTLTANFYSSPACIGRTVSFGDSSSGTVTGWEWNFGDGNSSSSQHPNHTYNATGNFSVTLIVFNSGCIDTITKSITVHSIPGAEFSFDTACLGNPTSFTSSASGTGLSFFWDFGDGNNSTSANPSYSYSSAGTFFVSLTATNSGGCDSTISHTVVVNQISSANFSFDTVCLGTTTSFNNSSSSPALSIWNYGDGSPLDTNNASLFSHSYASSGSFLVSLVVLNSNGCLDTITKTVIVNPVPIANLSAVNDSLCLNEPAAFLNNSTGASSYLWKFGDGNSSSAINPYHTYTSPGNYTAWLIAYNSFGCLDSASFVITILPGPAASFSADTVCLTASTSFTNNSSSASSFSWSFGDGNSSSANNPAHSYPIDGSFNASLIATAGNGCTDTAYQTIVVYPILTAKFSAALACASSSTAFTDSSLGTATSWYWSFGDGNSSAAQHPNHSYASAGNFNVKLIVSNAGCIDSISKSITVHPVPVAKFSFDTACLGGVTSFTNSSSGTGLSFSWNFGDGNSSAAINPYYVYAVDSTYSVSLIASTPSGCADTLFKNVIVYPTLTANFYSSPACIGRTVSFGDSSSGTVTGWRWDFGDGNSSVAQHPSHIYSSAGSFSVTLVVFNSGCIDTITKSITVHSIPGAEFYADTACLGSATSFTSAVSGSGLSFFWDFGDGNNSTSANPSYSYSSAGTFFVSLTATNSGGCDSTISHTVVVNQISSANFSFDTVCLGTTTSFNNSSSSPALSIWNYGDGSPLDTNNASLFSHSYASSGSFLVSLVVLNSNGCLDTITKTVIVNPVPIANLSAVNDSLCLNEPAAFLNNSTGASSYLWKFGDGNSSSAINPYHTYTSPGNYTAWLIAYNSFGCLDSASFVITILPGPAASFSADTVCLTASTSFTNNSSSASSFSWSFGDGNSSSANNPAHSYPIDGSFNASLIATAGNGCTDTAYQTIVVYPILTAKFSAALACASSSTAFTDSSLGTATSWYWSFGDGNSSAAQHPNHSYASAGNFNVKLIVSNAGCIDSISKSITVHPVPVAKFSFDTACLGGVTSFTNSSSGTGLSFSWNFGDGNSSAAINPYYVYAVDSNYSVSLIAATPSGCADTLFKNVIVYPTLTANFYSSPACIGRTVSFGDSSSGTVTGWEWNFGDGNSSSSQHPNHTYNATGNFSVTLIVFNSGCIDTITKSITVHSIPGAEFSFDTACLGNPTSFTSSASGTGLSFFWDFGDGNNSTSANPSYSYSSAGTFFVSLTATNSGGCDSTISHTVVVNQISSANFSFDTVCLGTTTSFNNSSSSPALSIWNYGDGSPLDTNNASLFSHSYASSGSFLVSLVVLNSNGCLDTITKTVIVNPVPIANLSAVNDSLCLNEPAAFLNNSTGASSYLWKFGDGNSSSAINPYHTYTSPGNYTAWLIAYNSFGCLDSASFVITILPGPAASFSADTVCLTASTSFTNNSSSASSFSWSFGDGNSSSANNPAHSYPIDGSFNASLIATAGNGCTDTAYQTIVVYPILTAKFSAALACASSSTAFTDSSLGTATSWYWSFGDGNSSAAQHPNHSYASAGNFNVKLIVSNAGCIDSISKSITVHPVPVAKFSFDTACLGGVTSFTNSSSGTGLSFSWNFGDGNSSAAINPYYVYAVDSTYSVSLIASTPSGCADTLFKNVIVYPTLTANFYSSPACIGRTVSFGDSSSGTVTGWRWDFGDGNSSVAQHPSHIYSSAGSFSVTLVVFNSGCIDTITKSITVHSIPGAEFYADTACLGSATSFTSAVSGSGLSFFWDFGDGNNSTSANPSYSYSSAGTFFVSLTATNSGGCDSTISHTVVVNQISSANFSFDTVCLGTTTSFNNSSSSPALSIWNYGDGSPLDTNNASLFSHSYASSGSFLVSLVVLNSNGCLDTITKTVIVNPVPIANLSAVNDSLCLNEPAAFLNNSTGASSYLWKFGDGNSSSAINPYHTYTSPGNYTAWLIAYNSFGCLDSASFVITILPGPAASFSADTVCLTASTSFTNNSSSASSFSWSFGDGNSSSANNPAHSYPIDGSFNASLIATAGNGCTDTAYQTIVVYPILTAKFSAALACASSSTAFTDSSLGTATSWYWSFGDGNSSAAQHPNHSYASAGNFNVKLIVSNAGCIDSISKSITVHPVPVAKFSFDTACLGGVTSFTNSSSGTGLSFSWNFGDGNSSAAINPYYVYAVDSNYSVSLIAATPSGCADTLFKNVIVYPTLTANFYSSPACIGRTVSFGDSSSGTVTGWEWNFGDGNSSSSQHPNHTYNATGNFSVTLIVFNSGCIDTITKSITVHSIPGAEFSFDTACLGNPTSFTSSASGTGLSFFWDFGDGNNSTSANPSYSYSSAGTFFVSLTATNSGGCDSTISHTVVVNQISSANFSFDTVCLGTTTSFNNSSSSPALSIWNYGDGSPLDTNNASLFSHSYASSGSFLVSLVVLNSNGCLDTITKTVIVNPVPIANLSAVNDSLCLNEPAAFLNNSTGASSYLWKFGDGNSSSAINPYHTYTSPGNYTAWLIAYNSFGCLDSASFVITILPGPAASFSADTVCLTASTSFTNNSSSASSFSWSFGDGNSSSANNPAHSYPIDGSFNASLIATAGNGCTDTAYQTIVVYPILTAKFSAALACASSSTAFTDSSLGTATSWYWSFGDGNSSAAQHPNHSYASAGNFNVKLIVSNAGCIDSISKSITVHPVPVAKFSFDTACLGGVTSFTNSSSGTGLSFSWNFGDGNSSAAINPYYVYAVDSNYSVSLIAATPSGCADTLFKNVIVYPTLTANFYSSPACIGRTVSFGDSSSGTVTGWEWNFGDGNSSSSQHPNHTYNATGNFSVTLIVFNSGCIDTITKSITVHSIPGAEFSFDTACLGNPTSFTSSASGTGLSFFWDFGDGNNSTSANPSYSYSSAGTFFVSLTATNSGGCDSTISHTVVVNQISSANFSFDTVCLGTTTSFNNSSSSPALSIWNYGDGSPLDTNNASLFSHSYASSGSFLVSLVVLNSNGCLDTITKTVIVNPVPIANLSAVNDSLCLNEPAAFLNNSTGASSYLWKFGDGNSSSAINPYHTYTSPGNYTAWLIAYNSFGCLDSASFVITILPGPAASFSADTVCLTASTSFTNNSSSASSFSWSFGDGNSSSANNPAHSYPIDGSFNASLIATAGNGCTDTAYQTIVVYPILTAKFSAALACASSSTAFTDSSLGTATSWYWSFGDGNSSAAQHPNHSYASAGNFNVKLIVSNAGCIDSISKSITVHPVPVAKFSFDTACLGGVTSFTNSSSGTGLSFSWNFGDGNSSAAINPYYVYGAIGNYQSELITTNSYGCIDTITKLVEVTSPPIASFNSDTVCLGLATVLTNSSTSHITAIWNYGDGSQVDTVYSLSHNHQYLNQGSYLVKLKIITSNGCVDSVAKTVIVRPTPITKFSTSFDTVCLGESVSFLNSSLYSTSQHWAFGDGNSSIATNPLYTYTASGTYSVRLITYASLNCADSSSKSVTVLSNPIAIFESDTVCLGNLTSFTNLSSGSSLTYSWNFGDGSFSNAFNPKHLYFLPGSYSVTLIIATRNGCSDTIQKTVVVEPNAKAKFNFSKSCVGRTTLFFDSSLGSVTSWYWDFGDGNTSTNQNPAHIYSSPGAYLVSLIVLNSSGCSDTISQLIQTRSVAVPNFSFNSVCLGKSTSFVNLTTSARPISTYFWDFGDGNNSISQNPSYNYSAAGTYVISLTVSTIDGCDSTISKSLTVSSNPIARFHFDTVCNSQTTSFQNTSIGNLKYSVWDYGDGTPLDTNSSSTVNHSYSNSGSYSAKLIVINLAGCSDTLIKSVVVYFKPLARFRLIYDSVCLNDSFLFINTSLGATNYSWDFGDGNNSNSVSPDHTFAFFGQYIVKLTASSLNGCVDSVADTVNVMPNPIANFIVDTVCLNEPSVFTNLSVGSGLSYHWRFGDGNFSPVSNPIHSYIIDSSYLVSLIAVTPFGCENSIQKTAVVLPIVEANFGFALACVGRSVLFYDSTKGTVGNYIWNFGDGSYSTIKNPTHSYSSPGLYTITLITVGNSGCSDTVSKILPVHTIPVPDFMADSSCLGTPTSFTNLSSSSQSISSYHWDFGDGNSSPSQNPSYVYSASGTYTVTLTITNNGGCDSSITKLVVVRPVPSANFFFDTVCLGLTTNFVDVSIGSVSHWYWNYGDGSPIDRSGGVVSHRFNASGTYYVQLTVKDLDGICFDQIIKPVIVYDGATASFSTPPPVCDGTGIQFVNNSTTSSGSIVSANWIFGDGTISSITHPTHLYATYGVYPVSLSVLSSKGCVDTATKNLVVNALPTANFNYVKDICVGNPTPFTDSSTIPVGTIKSWSWDFGDGNTDSVQHPVNSYLTGGTYLTTLIVTSDSGCTNTKVKLIDINPASNVDFSYTKVCVGDTVRFTNLSSITSPDSLVSWLWDFGDGSFSTLKNPIYVYSTDSQYFNVKLTVTSLLGCTNDTTIRISLLPVPFFNFGPQLFAYCTNDSVFFYDSSTIDLPSSIISWDWEFGNGNKSFNKNTFQIYDTAGTYFISLKLSTSDGCVFDKSIPIPINVYPNPVADFDPIPSVVSVFRPEIYFNNKALGATSYIWDFSDGTTSINDFPTHMFPKVAGDYRVTQFAYSDYGCLDTISKLITVKEEFTLYAPNSFTPDKEINTVFHVYGYQMRFFNLKIYNRWGELIYETTDKNNGWDGKHNGINCPTGMYIYQIQARDPQGNEHSKTGYVTLVR